MNIERVLEIFTGLSGLSEDSVFPLRFLCETAAEHIADRTRSGAEGEYGGRLEFAAAALAYYRYILWSMTDGGAGDITVGDISLKNGGNRLEYAERLCREAFSELSGILDDNGFVFERIGK